MAHHTTDEVIGGSNAARDLMEISSIKFRYVAAVVLDCMTCGLHEVLLLVYTRKLYHISTLKCVKLTSFGFCFHEIIPHVSHNDQTQRNPDFFIQGNVLMRQRVRKEVTKLETWNFKTLSYNADNNSHYLILLQDSSSLHTDGLKPELRDLIGVTHVTAAYLSWWVSGVRR